MNDSLKPWREVSEDLTVNPFDSLSALLTSINMDTDSALWQFNEDYHDADTWYTDQADILKIFENVANANKTKYQALIGTYPFSVMRSKVRIPDITRELTASSSGSADVTRNQTETQTETPNGYGQTRTHSVAPFDTTTFKEEYQDRITNNGSKKVSTSYSGDPDHTESESSGTRTDTESGTETTTETVIGSDKLTTAEAMADMAAAATIFNVIEKDIAAKLFAQVWR
jgi:hypothetical protein